MSSNSQGREEEDEMINSSKPVAPQTPFARPPRESLAPSKTATTKATDIKLTIPNHNAVMADGSSSSKPPLMTTPFPQEGVKLSYLIHEFVEQECGGQDAILGLTTEQVCEQYIKPKTENWRESFCQLLKRQIHPAYEEKAQVFISHAHQCNFWNLVTALQYKLMADEENPEDDIVIWLDIFSINQHATSDWTFEWLCDTFKSSIQQFGRTIMVMSPWNSPIPFTRAWCILEVYWTLVTSSKFEIAMGEDDRSQFLEDVGNNTDGSIKNMLSRIQAEESQCSVEEDRERIFAVIEASGGFSKINGLGLEQYRYWVIEVANAALNSCRRAKTDSSYYESELRRLHLLHITGNLYLGQGKFEEAKPLLEEAFVTRKSRLGKEHPLTLASMFNWAHLLHSQGHSDKAITLCRECWEIRKTVLGETHNDSL